MIRFAHANPIAPPYVVPVECERSGWPNKDANGREQSMYSRFDTEEQAWRVLMAKFVGSVESTQKILESVRAEPGREKDVADLEAMVRLNVYTREAIRAACPEQWRPPATLLSRLYALRDAVAEGIKHAEAADRLAAQGELQSADTAWILAAEALTGTAVLSAPDLGSEALGEAHACRERLAKRSGSTANRTSTEDSNG